VRTLACPLLVSAPCALRKCSFYLDGNVTEGDEKMRRIQVQTKDLGPGSLSCRNLPAEEDPPLAKTAS